jgi:phospholipid-transporting ATPase
LKPGNIVKIYEDEAIPADICLLGSSDPKGSLYIETKNLDGETNLKNKFIHKDINERFGLNVPACGNLQGTIYCEAPNNAIYKFEGQFLQEGFDPVPLGADNIILRGCMLRNTEYVYGIVVFSGHDTKIMMNSMAAKYKFSGLEKYTNYAIMVVLIT